MTGNNEDERKDKAYIERINWAHVRQLSLLAIMAALGIGAIQILTAQDLNNVLASIYILMVIIFAITFYGFFNCEGEILRYQKKLSANFEIKPSKSIFVKYKIFSEDGTMSKKKVLIIISISSFTFIAFLTLLISRAFSGYSNTVNVDLTIFLTAVIALFAIVQGLTSYWQYKLKKQINMNETATNELEKAYGPLHTLLNNLGRTDANGIRLDVEQKTKLDLILSTYPFMFPKEIKEYWRDNVEKIMLVLLREEADKGELNPLYHVPVEFREKVNAEYDSRVRRYEELIKP